MHLAPQPGVKEPLHQFRPSHPERILEVLVRAGSETVDGNGEALDTKFRHSAALSLSNLASDTIEQFNALLCMENWKRKFPELALMSFVVSNTR
jgi:hypothetical protein